MIYLDIDWSRNTAAIEGIMSTSFSIIFLKILFVGDRIEISIFSLFFSFITDIKLIWGVWIVHIQMVNIQKPYLRIKT